MMDTGEIGLDDDKRNTLSTFEFRLRAAFLYHHKFPALSRSLVSKSLGAGNIPYKTSKRQCEICHYCGSILTIEDYTCRLTSKPKAGKYIKKLKQLQRKSPWKLNNYHKRILKNETKAVSLVYRCRACHKISKRLLASKDLLKASKSNNFGVTVEAKRDICPPLNIQKPKQNISSLPLKPKQKKSKKKKQTNVKSQIKQMLQSQESSRSCRGRLESFLSVL